MAQETMLTTQQVNLIKNSWKLFKAIDPVLVGDVFYSKLFLSHPRLASMFTTPKHEQSLKLIEMLNVIIGRLEKLDELSVDISNLAKRHVGYGVKAEHYTAVGAALLWTLEQGLGHDWNEKVKEAWAACYSLLSNTMISAAGYK